MGWLSFVRVQSFRDHLIGLSFLKKRNCVVNVANPKAYSLVEICLPSDGFLGGVTTEILSQLFKCYCQ